MKKLVLEVQMSIDGFIAGENGNTDWMIWNWGPDWAWDNDLQEYHTNLTESADCILLSRQMAEEGFNLHWKTVAQDPKDSRYKFAKHITGCRKFIFSTSLKRETQIPGGWQNTEIADKYFVDFINDLKNQKGKDILVYGGAGFVSSLLKEGIIDEMHLMINPVALGNGLSIFQQLSAYQHLDLIKTSSFECGLTALHYRVKKRKSI